VRAVPIENEKVETIQPAIDRHIDTEAHLMTDGHRSYRQIGEQFSSHSTVIHSKGEYSRGWVHCNSSESFASLFERARFGVFHYLSKKHLQRYLHEFGFRWDHRVSEVRKTKSGKTKRVMKPIPVIDMLILLVMGFSGCHLKRTPQWGLSEVAFAKP
jgi:transposase-like protein